MEMRRSLLLLTLCPLLICAGPPASDKLTVLRFNTVCANCHEGECSGRLSFSLGPEATFNHIRRFAGDADTILVRGLQALLEQMKRECAYAPLPVPDMHGTLQREVLDTYRDPMTGNYFMPLGNLEPGSYQLTLKLESPVSLRVEILNRWFEFLVDECSICRHNEFPVTLEVEEASNHYLRLRSPNALRVEELSFRHEADESVLELEPKHD